MFGYSSPWQAWRFGAATLLAVGLLAGVAGGATAADATAHAGEDGWYGATAEAADEDATLRARPVTDGAEPSVSPAGSSPIVRFKCGQGCEITVDVPHYQVSVGGGDVGLVLDADGNRTRAAVHVPGAGAALP